MYMKLNDILLNKNFIKTTNTTSSEDSYSCTYVNNKIGVELFSNTSGSTGNITLSDSVSNYSYIEIIYSRSNVFYKSTGKITSNLSPILLDGFWFSIDAGNDVYQNFQEQITISGTTITRGDTYFMNHIGGGFSTGHFSGGINIHKVIGYK